jgi:hypothetical protein
MYKAPRNRSYKTAADRGYDAYSTKVRKLWIQRGREGANWAIGDTKAGTLIAKDRFGNKYFENLQDELPRTESPLLLRVALDSL